MANLSATFNIPGAGRGGKLTGGFSGGNSVLKNAEKLEVTVKWAGNPADAPRQLTAHFIFSSALDSLGTQAAPSPFLTGDNYNCYFAKTVDRSTGPGVAQYLFPAVTFVRQADGSLDGHYELTLVAEDSDTNTQWSSDPEFETGN